jgi:Fe-S cluster biosynthesis and repair protein YggX
VTWSSPPAIWEYFTEKKTAVIGDENIKMSPAEFRKRISEEMKKRDIKKARIE